MGMGTISWFINVTVDGYFEGPGHDISFFKGDREDNTFFREQSSEGATLLFGHRTYELMKSHWPTPQAQKENPEVAQYMNEMPKIVAAHRPFDPGWSKVTVLSGDVVEEIRQLKQKPGGRIVIMGSNSLCVSLMPEGLIDELMVMTNPIALGAGTPLFKGLPRPIDLKLASTRQFKSGKAVHFYRPAGTVSALRKSA